MIPRFLSDCKSRSVSLVPKPIPKPIIGLISGEISMAPMITGMELTFKPTEAMTIATKRM